MASLDDAHRKSVVQENSNVQGDKAVNRDTNLGVSAIGQNKELERKLIASLVHSYDFRANGLMKKTINVPIGQTLHHHVSHYRPDEAKCGIPKRPSGDESRC